MEQSRIYEDIALRTDGDIYIGVVGPVRTGKSTFIKRFMETLVIPNIENVYMKERARDELPQSGSGRTIMTAEPKFVPEDAVEISIDGGAMMSVRLIDCVGYMVDGAVGNMENGAERMVTTPWFDHEVPLSEAAETGTKKVVTEHSTIAIVVTTDGSITDIPREGYVQAEERVIGELKELGKPFIVLINSAKPDGEAAQELMAEIEGKYGVSSMPVNCMELDGDDIEKIIRSVLYEFPISQFGVYLPSWVDALPMDSEIKRAVYTAVRSGCENMEKISDARESVKKISSCDSVSSASIKEMELGTGKVTVVLEMPRSLFYETLSQRSGLNVNDDGDLMSMLTELAKIKHEYSKIEDALRDVRETGYGIVLPDKDELVLQEPEIVKQGGRYGVRLKASAPSIHMMMANIETEVSPAVGGERSSGDIINYLLQEFEGDVTKIWESNIFGKSLYDIASEGLNTKIKRMPDDAREKLRETLQRIINEGSGGLICIIL